MAFFEKLSHWTAFFGGLAAIISAGVAFYVGNEFYKGSSEDAQDTPPENILMSTYNKNMIKQIEANTILIKANQELAKAFMAATSSEEAINRNGSNSETKEIEEKINSLVSENKKISEKVSKITSKTDDINQVFEGWVYIGRFINGEWDHKTIKRNKKDKPPKENEVIEFSEDVNLRTNRPKFPLYRISKKSIPAVLKKDTKAIIIKIKNKVGVKNYSWARIKNK